MRVVLLFPPSRTVRAPRLSGGSAARHAAGTPKKPAQAGSARGSPSSGEGWIPPAVPGSRAGPAASPPIIPARTTAVPPADHLSVGTSTVGCDCRGAVKKYLYTCSSPMLHCRGFSSDGRARASHARGKGIDALILQSVFSFFSFSQQKGQVTYSRQFILPLRLRHGRGHG